VHPGVLVVGLNLTGVAVTSSAAQTAQQSPRAELGNAYSGEYTNLQTRSTGTLAIEVVRTDRSGWALLKAEWAFMAGRGEFEGAVTPSGEMDFHGLVESNQRIFEARLTGTVSGRTMRGTYTLMPTTGAERPQQQGEFFLLRRR
jgi:hypothetical protein